MNFFFFISAVLNLKICQLLQAQIYSDSRLLRTIREPQECIWEPPAQLLTIQPWGLKTLRFTQWLLCSPMFALSSCGQNLHSPFGKKNHKRCHSLIDNKLHITMLDLTWPFLLILPLYSDLLCRSFFFFYIWIFISRRRSGCVVCQVCLFVCFCHCINNIT